MDTLGLILLGISPDSDSSRNLAEELESFGYRTTFASSGYELIQKSLELGPSAIVLKNGLEDCDTLRTSVWLQENPRTSGIPIFLLKNEKRAPGDERSRINVLAEGIFSFAQGSPDCQAEDIANAINARVESAGNDRPAGEDQSDAVPTKDTVQKELDTTFERGYLTNLLMLQFLELSSSLGEIDYFTKNLLQRLTTIFDCEQASLAWNFDEIIEYCYVSKTSDIGLYSALRDKSERLLKDVGWEEIPHGGKVTWGRKFLESEGTEVSETEFEACSVDIEIRSRSVLRGVLTLVSPGASEEHWDPHILRDISTMLSLIFSNFMLYQDLEKKLARDNRIFQSFGELASISSLAHGGFKTYLLQSLLILLDLCSTSTGAVVIFSDEILPGQVQALGATEEFFLSLTSEGKKVIDIVKEKPEITIFQKSITVTGRSAPFDGDAVEDLVTLPLQCGEELFGVVMLAEAQPLYTEKEIEFLAIFATQISNQIYNHKAYSHEHLAKRAMEDQLNIARDIQIGLLPKGGVEIPEFDIFGRSNPATEVGGDFFDYYPLGNDRLGVTVADVSGKGLPASLLMSATMTTFRSTFEKNHNPAEFLTKANNILSTEFLSDKFLTTLFGLFDGNSLRIAGGGHHPLLIYRTDSDRFEYCDPSGMALGIIDDLEFEEIELVMYPNDVAVFFTDGLCDAKNADGEPFGYGNIEQTIRKLAGLNAEQIVNGLFSTLEEFTSGMPTFDDMTVVVAVKRDNDKSASLTEGEDVNISPEEDES